MTKRMLIDAAHADETRVVILDHDRVQDYDFITSSKAQIKGNIYLAKITRVEPSLQAAFVEYGGGKQGFLPFSEIHPDYYQLPQEDKQKLLEEQIAEAEAEAAAEDEAFEREQAARESRRGHGEHSSRDEGDEPDTLENDQGERGDEEALLHHESAQPESDADAEQAALDTPMTAAEPLIQVESLELPMSQGDLLHDDTSDSSGDGAMPLLSTDFAVHSDTQDALPEQAAAEGLRQADSLSPHAAMEAADSAPEDRLDGGDTTSEDAEETRNAVDRNARGFHRRYRIQEVIKRNQIVLVQIIKEERGNKGCSLTTFISLAGRCAVLMPNSPKGGGISRKITDRDTRRRLKEVASEMRTHRGMSVIIRTAGIDRTKAEIRRDYEYLVKLWNEVRTQTLSSSAPALIYEEGDLIKRSLRDAYSADIEEVIVEGENGYEEAKSFMRMLMPAHTHRIKLYKDAMPLFSYAGVEDQLAAMTEPQVKLPSGGYLVINPTEALISIDVNSGRSTTERNVEETALKTNLEAAAEVGRQMRLRDLAGLVVIDFIDMNYGKNRKAVERAMKDAVRTDRAKITLGRISMFGLMELSRQRMRPSISEAIGIPCPHCRGTGHVPSVETVGIQIIRTLEKEGASREYVTLRVTTTPEAALHLLNEKRGMLQSIEQRHKVNVLILMDTALTTGAFALVKVTLEGKEVQHDTSARRPARGGRRPRRGGNEHGGAGRVLDFSDVVEASTEEAYVDEFAGDDDDHEILIPSRPSDSSEASEAGERPRRERGERSERGGRNRNRGGRNRNRGGRGSRDAQETGDAIATESTAEAMDADAENTTAPEMNADGTPREPRGERDGRGRRRGRRGGRNRSERGERPDRATESGATPAISDPSNHQEPPAPKHFHSETRIETAVASYTPAAAPSVAPRVIPLSEAQTNPLAVASPIRSESSAAPSDGNANKRKGWWARVLEN